MRRPHQPLIPRPPWRVPGRLVLAVAAGLLACTGSDVAEEASRTAGAGDTVASERAWRGAAVEPPLRVPSVTLTDTRGRPYPLAERARGQVTLLFLGYTHCPDVCPIQLANLGAVLDDLTPSLRRHLQVVFVTIDPARDSAARIRTWLDRFGQGFVGLRGSEAEVAALQDSLRLPRAARQERRVRDRYTVGHASQVLAFGPDGRALRAYPSGTRQVDWRHDLPRLARRVATAGGEASSPGSDPPTGGT